MKEKEKEKKKKKQHIPGVVLVAFCLKGKQKKRKWHLVLKGHDIITRPITCVFGPC